MAAMLILLCGCKKTTEKVLDCFGESLLVSVHVTASSANPKLVATELRYSGSRNISSIKWEYGDGATQTTSGLSAAHTYAAAGNYTIKARVSFSQGKSSCEVDPTKNITVQ